MLLEIFSRTPLWVWPLFALLLWVGIRDLRDRWVPVWRPVILAIAFPAISIGNVFAANVPAVYGIALLLLVGALTAVPGWLTAPVDRLQGDVEKRRILVPGSVVSLAVILAIFVVRYYFGYLFGRYPEMRADATWHFLSIGLAALFSGFISGRNIRLMLAGRRLLTPAA